jgi:Glutaredoxin and related proteins
MSITKPLAMRFFLFLTGALSYLLVTTISAASASKYELIYFYKKDCHFCKIFKPALDSYAKTVGYQLVSYDIDDLGNQEIVNKLSVKGRYREVPVLFLLNLETLKAYLISSEYLDYEELAIRVEALLAMISMVAP